MKDVVKTKKKTPKMLKIGKSCVIILLKENTEKLQKIRQILIEESSLNEKDMDKPIRAVEEKDMPDVEELDRPNNEVVELTREVTVNEINDEPENFDTLTLFKNLNGKSSEDLITKFELDKMVPVKLDNVFKYCGIEVLPTDFKTYEEIPEISKIVDEKGLVLGAVAIKNNQINILYKKDDPPHRQRFTVAHELAHCCLNAYELATNGHVDYRLDIEEAAEGEYAANVFAGELLIPNRTLDTLYKAIKKPKVEILAKIFDVSENVMRARLKYLKLPFEDSVII